MRTVLRIAMRTTPIPVTVGPFEARRQHEGPKVTTVTRMEALRLQKRRQLRSYEDGDPDGADPCDCWHF